jgi:hypothetical protein
MPISPAPLTLTFLSTFLLFDLLTLTAAFSWYDKGHRIVGLIAQANLTAEARKEIEKILPGSMSLADAAVWPDHEGRSIRDFDPLHYVSIPENAGGYDQARDCPERNCMVEAFKWFSAVIADKDAPIMMRRLALRYVAHLVGDIAKRSMPAAAPIGAESICPYLTKVRQPIFTFFGTQTWSSWKRAMRRRSPRGLARISRKKSVANGRPAVLSSGQMNRSCWSGRTRTTPEHRSSFLMITWRKPARSSEEGLFRRE